jgi:hypothetical protein
MLKPTDLITFLLNTGLLPACAVDVKLSEEGLRYHHPTRGWKRVSAKRIDATLTWHVQAQMRKALAATQLTDAAKAITAT